MSESQNEVIRTSVTETRHVLIFMFLIFEPSVTKENLWLKPYQQSFMASFIDMKQSLRNSFHLPTSLNSFRSLCYFLALHFHLCVTCVMIWMPLRWQWTGVLHWASCGNASQSLWAETDSTQGHTLYTLHALTWCDEATQEDYLKPAQNHILFHMFCSYSHRYKQHWSWHSHGKVIQ